MAEEWIEFPCIEVTQPLGTFYVGVMDAPDLVEVALADIRRISDRDVEQFAGIQRPLDRTRVRELSQYVNTVDATFPTSIILAVKSDDADFDPAAGVMRLRREGGVANIIDGQHRIAGLEAAEGQFQSGVTIFIDMDIEDQANVFATINLRQTKVNRSLAFDLFEFAKARSPQKTAHDIARLLNFEPGSPLGGRIKLLGVATPGVVGETLTQALVVDRLLALITDDPMKDRDDLRRGRRLRPTGEGWERLPFRNMFVREDDHLIARNVWNLFAAVERRWPAAWGPVETGYILNRTTGFTALMRFLGLLFPRISDDAGVVETGQYYRFLRAVNLSDDEFHRDRFTPGSSGVVALLRVLSEALPH